MEWWSMPSLLEILAFLGGLVDDITFNFWVDPGGQFLN